MRKLLIIGLVIYFVSFAVLYAQEKKTEELSPELKVKIEKLVKQLGADDWRIREEATQSLRQLGLLAAEALEKAIQDPDPEVVYRARGLLSGLGLYYHSLSLLWEEIAREVKEETIKDWENHLFRAQYHRDNGNLQEAEREYIKAIILSRRMDNVSRQNTASVCFELGRLYASKSNWSAAIECYAEGLSRDPWQGEINYLLGEAYEAKGDQQNALSRYRISLRLNPLHDYADQAKEKIERLEKEVGLVPQAKPVILKDLRFLIMPLNIINKDYLSRLHQVGNLVKKDLGISVEVLKPVNLINKSLLKRGKQYDGEKLVDLIDKQYQENFALEANGLIGITGKDITASSCNYLFALTRVSAGIISYARFRHEFHGELHNEQALVKRISIQLKTSIGRALGLDSCHNPDCVMTYPGSVSEFDKKTGDFCNKCKRLFEGYGLASLKKYNEAIKIINEHLKDNPMDAGAYFKLGMLYWNLQDWDAVVEALENVLKLQPGNKAAQNNLERVKEFKNK